MPADRSPRTRATRARGLLSRETLHLEATAIAFLLTAVVLVAALVVLTPPAGPTTPARVALTLEPGAPLLHADPLFWGANVGLNVPASTLLATTFAATPVELVRWPGGAAGDELNYTTGILTNGTGAVSTATMSLPSFVAWCRSIACHALLELPAEIDDPATAAYYVAYTEKTLGFDPALWEVGNEPAIWTHFGIPWSQWNATQNVNATPVVYAHELHTYLSAIHRVDPAAQVLGLPGVGTGGFGEPTWIAATIAVNGPNISGIGIHAYPAGATTLGNPTTSSFFSNVSGAHSLGARLSLDRATIAASDPTNPSLPIAITELGSGNNPGGASPFLQGYDQVVFIASELLTALDLNASQADLTQVQTPQAGQWLDANGSFHPLYTLYREWLPELGPTVVPTVATPAVGDLFSTLTTNGSSGPSTLIIDNADPTVPAVMDLSALGFSGTRALDVWTWNSTAPVPLHTTRAVGSSMAWTVPPLGLLMLRIAGAPGVVAGHAVGTASSTIAANAPSISTADARWRWEICSTFTPIGTESPVRTASARTSR